MKTPVYKQKSNARRGAKRHGLNMSTVQIKQADGGWYCDDEQTEPEAPEQIVIDLPEPDPEPEVPEEPEVPATSIKVVQLPLPIIDEPEPAKPKHKKKQKAKAKTQVKLNSSTVENPCQQVRDICNKLSKKGKKRKDILLECEKRGIAYHTARTQYQLWKTKKAKAGAK